MSKEEINSLFEKKLMRLQDTIENNLQSKEGIVQRELLSAALVMLLRNTRDLYGLNKLLFNMLLEFRDIVDKMTSEPEVRNQLVALKNFYDLKFEMLGERLKRINAKDEEELRKN
jgi:hypothetical protein